MRLRNSLKDGIYWISRLKANSYLADETGERLALEKMLAETETENTFITKRIWIGKRKQLPAYLIAQRLTEAETHKRRRYIRYRAKRKCQTPSKARLRLAGWNLYITNIEAHQLTPKQICAIVGIRWQIELMFKAFKSIGKLQDSVSEKPYRILSEIYAKTHRTFDTTRHYVRCRIPTYTTEFHQDGKIYRRLCEATHSEFSSFKNSTL